MPTILTAMATADDTAPQVASLDDVRAHAAGISSKWYQCRAKGHRMVAHWATMSPDEQGYDITERCTQCGTKKRQILDFDGIILHSEYEYPEGYTLPKGTGRLDSRGRGVFRLAIIIAKMEHQADAEERRQKRKSA